MFFVEISDVVAGKYPKERNFRIGGLVVGGTLERDEGSLDVRFDVTDTACVVPVVYSGVLPDLFREGQGAGSCRIAVQAPEGHHGRGRSRFRGVRWQQ